MSDLVGRLIAGKYRVTERLGSGGVAEVFEAVHEEIGQRFAIKVLRREFANFPEVADRFLVEARAASAVRHPGVVQIFDIGKLEEGEPYLVMELLRGENLTELLRRNRRLTPDQAVSLAIHVLDALDAAHQAGIVHRDLKPENILLVRGPGGEPWAKIIDFGIARLGQEGAAAMRLTAQGTVMGTPYYMSPEQARGVLSIDARADVYAVGVMLYEMVTGKLPFEGNSPTEVLTKALTEPFPFARDIVPSISPALEEVIFKATERKRELRYQSAGEFAAALRPLRPELVAVELLPEGEPAEAETTTIRRLKELVGRPAEWRPAGLTPPRISHTPRPSLPSGRPPSPPRGSLTPPGVRRSITPPPIRPTQPGLEPLRNTIVISRWAVFVGATLGIAAVAAAVGALLVVLSDRSTGSGDAAVASNDYVVTAAGRNAEPANLSLVADRSSRSTPVRAASPLAEARGSGTRRPGPEPAPGPTANSQQPTASLAPEPETRENSPHGSAAPAPRAIVRLEGLPDDARATLDGVAVGPEFPLEVSDEPHTLRVVARGRKPFVHVFRVVGDTTIRVVLEETGATREQVREQVDSAEPATTGASDPALRPLANPFATP